MKSSSAKVKKKIIPASIIAIRLFHAKLFNQVASNGSTITHKVVAMPSSACLFAGPFRYQGKD